MKNIYLAALFVLPLMAREPLAQRISHTDPSKFRPSPAVHGGAGTMAFGPLFTEHSLETNLQFLHRGVLAPHSGIGVHYHNQCEEMFVILDGEAQFTVDGRTAVLKGPAGAPTRMGHSHAIYNHTDQPVQWMNINVTNLKASYDAFNLGDDRVGAPIDKVPNFMYMKLYRDDRTLRTVNAAYGGKGSVQYRRALDATVFLTPWAYVDHLIVPPGASLGNHTLRDQSEFYYVMDGQGTMTVAGETAPIVKGDAIPIQIAEAHGVENTGTEPLEIMIVGVSRENTRNVPPRDFSATSGGGRGFGGGGGRGPTGAPPAGGRGPAGAPPAAGPGRGN